MNTLPSPSTAPLERVVIAGASGFMGSRLTELFERDGVVVTTIGRRSTDAGHWSEGPTMTRALEGADAVINLAGRTVNCRYSRRKADEILRSRTETTKALGAAIANCETPPRIWLNASTGTIYRDARDRPQDETMGEFGSGFSVAVAREWERELFSAPVAPAVRKVALRTSIAFGAGGGALNPLVNLARLGLGGRQGDGQQRVSWIHLDDVYGAIRHIISHESIVGPVNLASPNSVTNAEQMRAVRHYFGGLGERVAVPVPSRLLDVGAVLIRTETELVLKSRWVDPGVLRETGYEFTYPTLDEALAAIAKETPAGLLPVPR